MTGSILPPPIILRMMLRRPPAIPYAERALCFSCRIEAANLGYELLYPPGVLA